MTARVSQIRAAANRVRAEYMLAIGKGPPDALPVEDLAYRLYRLEIFPDPMLDRRINGELNPKVRQIRLCPDLPRERQRFVAAHELGHWVLEGGDTVLFRDDDTTVDERAFAENINEVEILRSYNTRERHEEEANRFALELLIPADVLWMAVQRPSWTVEALARRFIVSIDALLSQLAHVCCREPVVSHRSLNASVSPAVRLSPDQQEVVGASVPTLVIGGPGTGKTQCTVARYQRLVEEGVDPSRILVLSYSNQSAEQLRGRIAHALVSQNAARAEMVDIMTFQGWSINVLNTYGHHVGIPLDARLLDTNSVLALLMHRLPGSAAAELALLQTPRVKLAMLVHAVGRAKDELWTSSEYRSQVEAYAERLLGEPDPLAASLIPRHDRSTRLVGQLRDLATFYDWYTAILDVEHVLDYGDLVLKAVAVLRKAEVLSDIHEQYEFILLDDFQDLNRASAELVFLLDGGRGHLWAAGDPSQQIYQFRGASTTLIEAFNRQYPDGTVATLATYHRSSQPVLHAAQAVLISSLEGLGEAKHQRARRSRGHYRAVVERVAPDEQAERDAIGYDIVRRVRMHPTQRARSSHRRTVSRYGARLVARGWPRRPAWRFADHAVLYRSHREGVRLVAALEACGIPVNFVGEIFTYPEVQRLLALYDLVDFSGDEAVRNVSDLPEYPLDETDISTLTHIGAEQGLPLWKMISDGDVLDKLSLAGRSSVERLACDLQVLTSQGDAWCGLAHYLFDCDSVMRERLRKAARGDLRSRRELMTIGQLLYTARAYVDQAPVDERDAAAFAAHVRRLRDAGASIRAISLASEADVVRVMSMHASKGREFPIVYVPGLEEGRVPPLSRDPSVPSLPDLLQHGVGADDQSERQLLYVAMTRAHKRLILSRVIKRNGREARRSPLLPGGPDGSGAPWPVIAAPPSRRRSN